MAWLPLNPMKFVSIIAYRYLSAIPDSHQMKPVFFAVLGSSLQIRFNHLGDLADINRAIEYLTRSVLPIPTADLTKVVGLKRLATSYESRFRRLENLADIGMVIDYRS
jgi:hypothetical protein